jgi:hypothetical protein
LLTNVESAPQVKRVLVKNTPQFNDMLREVKHLVRIMPLKFPYGVPKNPTDYEHCFINSRGELVVKHTVHPAAETPEPSVWEMQRDTYKKDLRRKLELNQVNKEYFSPEYKWKLNEDGKEHRYSHNRKLPKYKPLN